MAKTPEELQAELEQERKLREEAEKKLNASEADYVKENSDLASKLAQAKKELKKVKSTLVTVEQTKDSYKEANARLITELEEDKKKEDKKDDKPKKFWQKGRFTLDS